MKKFNAKKILAVLLSLMLIVVIAFTMVACTGEKKEETDKTSAQNTTLTPPAVATDPVVPLVVGEGQTSFLLDVYHKDGSVVKYEVNTDVKTVGEALLQLKIIDGEDGQYGLYVKTVDGETLDYDKDQMYWAFYAGGEYAQTGVDQTEINKGVVYALKAEK